MSVSWFDAEVDVLAGFDLEFGCCELGVVARLVRRRSPAPQPRESVRRERPRPGRLVVVDWADPTDWVDAIVANASTMNPDIW